MPGHVAGWAGFEPDEGLRAEKNRAYVTDATTRGGGRRWCCGSATYGNGQCCYDAATGTVGSLQPRYDFMRYYNSRHYGIMNGSLPWSVSYLVTAGMSSLRKYVTGLGTFGFGAYAAYVAWPGLRRTAMITGNEMFCLYPSPGQARETIGGSVCGAPVDRPPPAGTTSWEDWQS